MNEKMSGEAGLRGAGTGPKNRPETGEENKATN